MRELTKSREKTIFGVAGGLAEYFDIDPILSKALWIFFALALFPIAVLAYIILAVVLPSPTPAYQPGPPAVEAPEAGPTYQAPRRAYRRMAKSDDRWLFGVAGGIAQYFDVDPVLVRALFLIAFFCFGTGLLAYLILAILMPRPTYEYR